MEPADTAFFETSPDTTCTPKRAIYHNIQPTGKQAQRIIYWEHVRENSTFFLKAKKKKKLAKQLPLFLIPGICLLTKPGSPPNLSKSKKRVEYPLVWFIISQSDSPKAKFSFRCIDVLFCFFSHQKRKRHNHSREFYSSVIQIKTHTYRTMQQWHT